MFGRKFVIKESYAYSSDAKGLKRSNSKSRNILQTICQTIKSTEINLPYTWRWKIFLQTLFGEMKSTNVKTKPGKTYTFRYPWKYFSTAWFWTNRAEWTWLLIGGNQRSHTTNVRDARFSYAIKRSVHKETFYPDIKYRVSISTRFSWLNYITRWIYTFQCRVRRINDHMIRWQKQHAADRWIAFIELLYAWKLCKQANCNVWTI